MKNHFVKTIKISEFYFQSYAQALEKYNYYLSLGVNVHITRAGDMFKVVSWTEC